MKKFSFHPVGNWKYPRFRSYHSLFEVNDINNFVLASTFSKGVFNPGHVVPTPGDGKVFA